MKILRSLPLCLFASAFVFSAAAVAQHVAPAVRIVSTINESNLVTLRGSVHPLANSRNDRGVAPDSLQIQRMHLVLKRSDAQEAALRQLIADMHTPGSANYHKWLTPTQFGAQFGPSDQDIATVTNWLSNHGFNVIGPDPGRQTLEFSGTVAQLRSAFHTQIHRYLVNGVTHFANSTDPQIPAALAPVVGGFDSLNNFRIKPQSHFLGHASYSPTTGKATPQWTIGNGSASGDDFVMSPADFYAQYDLNPLYNAGTNGSGQTIAIINDSNINVALANQFRTLFGLPANPPQVIVDGNDPGVDGINNPDGPNYDSSEAYIDVEWAGAVAPDATIDLVIAADTDLEQGLVLAAEHAVYGNIAPVISVSFGQCEAYLSTSTNAFLENLWEQAAAQGITVLVSSGDSGSAGCDDPGTENYAYYGQNVNGFASTPFNVAVGGTDFYYSDYATGGASIANYWNTTATNTTPGLSIKNTPIPEQAWNDSQFGDNIYSVYTESGGTQTSITAGGGGVSALYAKPSWQTGFGTAGARTLPDVSLFAANGLNSSYYPVCAADGDCQPVTSGTVQISGYGGTSVSAPQFAAIMALINQKYGRQGQANYTLYPLSQQYPAAFHDVTHGSNSVPCDFTGSSPDCLSVSTPITLSGIAEGQIGAGTTPEYNATTGYDMATGLGSVDANTLVTDWNKITFASSSATLTVTPSSGTVSAITGGTSVTFSGTVTGSGTPTGAVALMTDSPEPVNQGEATFTLNSSGQFSGSLSYLPGGTYNVWVHYPGDAANGPSDSPKTQITVSQTSSGIFFNVLTPPNSIVSSGASNIPYGTQLILEAQVTPASDLTAVENCETGGSSTCPTYAFPTGTITFSDTTSSSGLPNVATINAEGDAEFNAPFTIGSHSVKATYSGDNSYGAVTSSAVSFSVVKDTPDIQYNSSIQTGSGAWINGLGQPTVISIQVLNSGVYNALGSTITPVPVSPPTGSITYSISGTSISNQTASLVSGVDPYSGAPEGITNIVIPAGAITTPGNYTLTVNYPGDANYYSAGGTSPTIQFVAAGSVNGGLQSTISATTSGSISPSTNITVSGTLTGLSGHPAPTCSQASGYGIGVYASGYSGNSNLLDIIYTCPAASSNTSTFTYTLNSQILPQGVNLIILQYTGDANYAPSATTLSSINNLLWDFTLVPHDSLVALSSGGNATDAMTLSSTNGFSGAVTLTCTAATGVTCSVTSPVTLAAAGTVTATLSVQAAASTATGNYNVLVTAHDSTGQYIHTAAVTAEVTATPYSLSSGVSSLTLAPGATTGNTATITVNPGAGGYSGTVSFSCGISPSVAYAPTCSFSPSSVTLSGTTPQTTTLTINTTAATALNHTAPSFWPAGGGAVLALLFGLLVPRRRRGWYTMFVLLAMLVSGASIACGGSGGSGGGSSGGNTGTPANTYVVTVKGTSSGKTYTTSFNVIVN